MTEPKRILIVDDESKVAFFLREGLEGLGERYEVISTDSAENALLELAASSFDLIVTDFRLPGLNGLQLIEHLRKSNPTTRTILITAYGSDEVEAAAYRLRARRYLSKPFRIEDFVHTVREVLGENPRHS
ncbi:MAG: response regulator [Chloroflexota bacterium]|nr:response regulator [Chloroflexota bacterium]